MSVRRNGQVKKKDPLDALDDGSALAELLRPFYEQLIEQAYLDAADLDLDVSFDLENEYVQGVLDELAQRVKDITSTTRTDIQNLVGKQASEGWSMARLANEIRASGDITSRNRAETIARSESAHAYSQGSLAAYKASGVVSQTEWLIGPDSCDECQALDGVIVGIDEEFAPGVTAPPLHPRCTCAISPVLSD